MKKSKSQLGENIRRMRLERDMTMADVAKVLYTSQQQVGKYELGFTVPSIEAAIRICEALNCSILDLLKGCDVAPCVTRAADEWRR